MARPLRIEYDGACYHVTARGNEGKRIYRNKSDYRQFKWYMTEAKEKFNCLYHAYVLMPTHYHLLIETPDGNLSEIMQYVNSSYAMYHNTKWERIGHLFQGRYKSILVERDSYFLELNRYLHLNPVRADIVEQPDDYVYSSYHAYVGNRNDSLITTEYVLGMFGNNERQARKRYREFVTDGLSHDLENPFKHVIGQAILGSEEFVTRTLKGLNAHETRSPDIAYKGAFSHRPGVETILRVVSDYYGVSREDLLTTRNREYRMMAIYLLKTHTPLTNTDIGKLFNGISYSAVSHGHRRFSERLKTDIGLGKKLRAISEAIADCQ